MEFAEHSTPNRQRCDRYFGWCLATNQLRGLSFAVKMVLIDMG
jgi:hypothetical protein